MYNSVRNKYIYILDISPGMPHGFVSIYFIFYLFFIYLSFSDTARPQGGRGTPPNRDHPHKAVILPDSDGRHGDLGGRQPESASGQLKARHVWLRRCGVPNNPGVEGLYTTIAGSLLCMGLERLVWMVCGEAATPPPPPRAPASRKRSDIVSSSADETDGDVLTDMVAV